MKRLLIVANRLPITVKQEQGNFKFSKSGGGLATGLDSLKVEYEKHWIGWPGIFPKEPEVKKELKKELEKELIHPVFITKKQMKDYYEGFSNKTLWPLFHYFNEYVQYDPDTWKTYKAVNEIFCDHVVKMARPDDIIWVQDYHLMLLPQMLREKLPDAEIGFFLHIPFPSYELFRTLAWREELLNGLLGADLIGFHTYEYMRHFMSAIYRVLGHEPVLGRLLKEGREVQVDTFPMGIDYQKFHEAVIDKEVQDNVEAFSRQFGGNKLILSVDRLDYSKGILQRLKAFNRFLEKNPGYKESVSLIVVAVPSRSGVEQYQLLKEELDEAVGNINGKHATINWTPVYYFYRSFDFPQLAALYNLAEIALVTPFRDGMNLVAKEFVATKREGKGILILSEMAGTAIELEDALIINPNHIEEIVKALEKAMLMTPAEQKRRLEKMQEYLRKQSIQKWANDFIQMLDNIRSKQKVLNIKKIDEEEINIINKKYRSSKKRLILLDYDGTLIRFFKVPSDAKPDKEILDLLENLNKNGNTVVLISGRDHKTLSQWFKKSSIEIIAEHGTWYFEKGEWVKKHDLPDAWKPEVMEVLEEFVVKTPGTFVEEKPYSLAWHYRNADIWIADLRVREIINALIQPCNKNNLDILDGDKVIEVKVSGVNKGMAANHWIEKDNYDMIMAIGDDRTDEDIFAILPRDAISIKVGNKMTKARFSVSDHREVRNLLKGLTRGS